MKQSKTFSSGFSVEDTIESLHRQLSEVLEVKAAENASWNAAYNIQAEQIESLRQQLNKITEELHAHQIGHDHIIAEKDAEIEHLDRTKAEGKNTAKLLDEKLAASQAREAQLREATECLLHLCDAIGMRHGPVLDKARQALALPQDISALEAMIAKAGEVMRERCERESWRMAPVLRSIPGVTMEDLQK